jgi:hypothetical protein
LTGISSERSASSAACSDSASRTGGPSRVIRSMPGTQPTVEIPVFEVATPSSGSRSHAASTASRFMSGSPMPMKTAWLTASTRLKCSAWSRISDAVRLRPNFIRPVAQNVQVSGQPDWLERQIERRPSR